MTRCASSTPSRARLVAALLIASTGCSSSWEVRLPANPDAKATLVGLEKGGGLDVIAFENDARDFFLEEDGDTALTVTVLSYDRTLAALQLEPGTLQPALAGEPARPLPQFTTAVSTRFEGGDTIGWQTLLALVAPLSDFRIPLVSPETCVDTGGCFVTDEGQPSCTIPCPAITEPLAPLPPVLPEEPERPVFLPCPDGWSERLEGDITTCEPPARASCANAQYQWVSSATCGALGPTCPAGAFPAELPPGRPAVYVRAGATGGDGSAAAPYGSLAGALATATAGSVIAVGKGVYAESVTVPSGIWVVGACVAETEIRSSAVTVSLASADAALRNLRIAGGTDALVIEATATNTRLENIAILEAGGAGVRIRGGAVDADGLVVDGAQAGGILVENGGQLDARRVLLTAVRDVGVLVADAASRASFEDLYVADTETVLPDRQSDHFGQGARVQGGSLSVHRALFERTETYAISADARGRLTLEQVVLRDMKKLRVGDYAGKGINLSSGSTASLRRVSVERALAMGIYLEASTATISDVVVRGTRERVRDNNDGEGIAALAGSQLWAERVASVDNTDRGIWLNDDDTTGDLRDIIIRDTKASPVTFEGGWGLGVEVNATAVVSRAHIANSRDCGVCVGGPGNTIVLDNVSIEDTAPTSTNGSGGQALRIDATPDVRLSSVRIANAHLAGIVVSGDDTGALMSDIEISNIQLNGTDDMARGIWMIGGRLQLERASLSNLEGRGIRVVGYDTTLDVTDLHIDRAEKSGVQVEGSSTVIMERARIESILGAGIEIADQSNLRLSHLDIRDGRSRGPFLGAGIYVRGRAVLDLRSFALRGHELYGLFLGSDAAVLLNDGIIEDNRVGVLVVDPSYDTRSLMDHVQYRGNGDNISFE